MIPRILLFLTLCCYFGDGAVFDPYSRRYNIFKDTMPSLLQTPSGGTHCTLIQGMYDLTPKTQPQLTAAENATYISWVQSIETNIIQNAAITDENEKFLLIAAEMQRLELEQIVIFQKVEYVNISTWAAFENVIHISREWTFERSLELIIATSEAGNCKLFDLLLMASSSDAAKQAALATFIDTELKPIIADSTLSQKEIIVKIYRKFETEFFVGAQASWRTWFYTLKLDGFFAFSQWSDAADSYYKETTYESLLEGEGMDCQFIVALNKTLSNPKYTPTQKGHFKQLMNYFTQQFPGKTNEERLILISMKFSESIDTSYGYFATIGGMQIDGWGSFYELIIFSCQYETLPPTCGCVIPTFEPGTGSSSMPSEGSSPSIGVTDEVSESTSPSSPVSETTSEAPSSSATDFTEASTTINASESTDFTQSTQASEASSIFTTASIIPSTVSDCECACS